MTSPLRALFVNQGSGGAAVMGHLTMESLLRRQIEAMAEVEARFSRLPPLNGLAGQVVRPVPALRFFDLDLQTVRWHITQGARARRLVRASLAEAPADVLHLHSHVLAFGLTDVMRSVPTALSVDATVWDHHAMGIWRPVRRTSRAAVGPSVRLERRALRRAALVLAWSAWARRGVQDVCPAAHVVEHHPGIDTALYRPDDRDERQVPRLLFVGGRFSQKGGEDVLTAMGPALRRGELELDVVTQSGVRPHVGVRSHRLGVHDPELIRLYQQADAFCLPSHADASPWAVVEALACGTPVVGSDVGAIPDLIGDAGSVVPAGDIAALREELGRLVADPLLRQELGRRARNRALTLFDAHRNTTELVRLLREAAAGGAP